MKKISAILSVGCILLPFLVTAKIYQFSDGYGNRIEIESSTTLKAKGVFMNYNGGLYAFQDRYSLYFRAFPAPAANSSLNWRLYKVIPSPAEAPFGFGESYEKKLNFNFQSAPGGQLPFVAATFFADLNGNGLYEPTSNNNPFHQYEFASLVGSYLNIADFKLWETIKNVEIASNQVAYISAHAGENGAPAMPQLQAWFDGAPPDCKVLWRFDCTYKRPVNPNQLQDRVVVPTEGTLEGETDKVWQLNSHPDWIIQQTNGFFGGQKCQIVAQIYHPTDGTFLGKVTHPFKIGGENPQDDLCKQFILAHSPTGTEWFAYAMAKHESSLTYGATERYYNQFWESAVPYPGRKPAVGMPMHAKYERDGPGGFGIFQVTGDKVSQLNIIPRNQIWNWRANIRAGLAIVKYKRDEIPDRNNAIRWMNGMLRMTKPGPSYGLYEGQRPQMKEHRTGLSLPEIPVPAQKEAKIIFGDAPGLKLVEDGVNIKLYNGAEKQYCYYEPKENQKKGGWVFKPGPNDYVKQVSKQVEE